MKKYNIEIFRQANISNKLFLRKGILNLLLQGYTIEKKFSRRILVTSVVS